jgi:glycosyltransferase involved in cell wall biosynthesis
VSGTRERPERLLIVATMARTIEGFLLPFAEHFRRLGWRVDAAAAGATRSRSCREAFDSVFEVAWSRNPLRVDRVLRSFWSLRSLMSSGYDLVHVHTPVAGFVTRSTIPTLGRSHPPVVYTAHGFHFQTDTSLARRLLFSGLERLAGRWTDELVVINDEDFQAAQRMRLVPPQRVTRMQGIGVDTDALDRSRYEVAAAEVRRELGLAGSDTLVTLVAEFIPRKRHEDAVAAFRYLRDPSIHLAFVGDGPRANEMRALVRRHGLQGRVHFLGFRGDVPAVMVASQVLILVSAQEGLPRSILEAQALGVPVIGTDIRGTRDLLVGGRGTLVRPRDPQALAAAIRALVGEPTVGADTAAAARATLEPYSQDRILAEHERLYRRALRPKAGEGPGLDRQGAGGIA